MWLLRSRTKFVLLLYLCFLATRFVQRVEGVEGVEDDEDSYEYMYDDYRELPFEESVASRQANVGGDFVFPTLFATISVPGVQPRSFRDRSLNYSSDFVNWFRKGLPKKPTVRIHGVQGEDSGTGVHVAISWIDEQLTETEVVRIGKENIARSKLYKLFPGDGNSPFGRVHTEGLSGPCYTHANGTTPSILTYVPSLNVAIALEKKTTKDSRAVRKMGKSLAKSMERWLADNHAATGTTSWFWHVDNDEKIGGHVDKPVFNFVLKGYPLGSLQSLHSLLQRISRKEVKSRKLFPAGLRIHLEGGSHLPRICAGLADTYMLGYGPLIVGVEYAGCGSRSAQVLVQEPKQGVGPFNLTGLGIPEN
jgi:hypothetical protein